MTYFLPYSKTFDTSHVAKLFLKEIVRLYGLPNCIMLHFISYFWNIIWKLLGIKQKFSLAYYPQTNG